MNGHSVLELMISIIIFSLFLLGLMTVMDVGLKSWNMVNMKSEVQEETIISLNLLSKDLRLTDRYTAAVGNTGEEYIAFENPMGEDGYFHYDGQSGDPEWQGYIIYYTYPRNAADSMIALDKSLTVNKRVKKMLIRRRIKHTANCNAAKITNVKDYFTDPNSSVPNEVGKAKILSDHVYSMEINKNPINSDAIDVKVIIQKSILEDRLAYTKNFSEDLVNEKMDVKTTIMLKNTK